MRERRALCYGPDSMKHGENERTGNVCDDRNTRVIGDDGAPLGPLWFSRMAYNPFGETWGADIVENGCPVGGASIIEDDEDYRSTLTEHLELRGDERLRCVAWLNRVRSFAVHRFLPTVGADLGIGGDPLVFVWSNDDSPRGEHQQCIRLLWPSSRGGGVELFLSKMGAACGQCLGCKSVATRTAAPVSRVYFVQALDGGPVKIGRSIDPESRVLALQTANAEPLRVVATMLGGSAVERMLHRMFERHRVRVDGEWFRPAPEVLAFIRELGGRPT